MKSDSCGVDSIADEDLFGQSLSSTSLEISWGDEEEEEAEVGEKENKTVEVEDLTHTAQSPADEYIPLPASLTASATNLDRTNQSSLSTLLSTLKKPGNWTDQRSKRDLCVWILHRWHFWPLVTPHN